MNSKRGWSIIGLFIIALVVSLPIYSANVLAVSVQITKNQGQAAIPQFLDAQGDVWTVEATITGAPEAVNPSDVKIKIGSNEALFQSCSPTALGTACEYLSPLTDGVMEGEYAFQAIYTFLNALGLPESVSNSDVIKADGSGPTIEFKKLQQNDQGQVEIDFTVKDKKTGAPAVGVKTIEILDADSGTVLQTINLPNPGTEQYNYDPEAGTNGILPATATLSGEGLKRIKLRAEDWLGHQGSQNPIKDFPSDFVVPVIKDNLNFTKIGKFIGNNNVVTAMTVDIVETDLKEVKASSGEASLDNTPAHVCVEDGVQEKLWHCTWEEVELQPSESIAVSILATDHFGNSASRTLSYKLTKDSSAPQIDFFGSERQFENQNFVRDEKQRIILRVKEQGAGITEEGIRANLLALGKGTSEAPTSCGQTESSFNCFWETSESGLSGVARIGLSKFEDRVGNQGETPEIELVADNAGPKVEKLEVFGVSDIGEKNYFQSNDRLKIKFKVVETYGLAIFVDVNDVVLDAETKFPPPTLSPSFPDTAGLQEFGLENCVRAEDGSWSCSIETEPIKSGPDPTALVRLIIQDTAGNNVRVEDWPESAKNIDSLSKSNEGATLTFNLLALSEENAPDFWEVSKVLPLGGTSNFIDLDTTQLTFTRLPLEVRLKTKGGDIKAVDIKLDGCEPKAMEEEDAGGLVTAAPLISRSIVYKSVGPDGEHIPKPKLILEFEPFDGRALFNIGKQEERTFTKQEVPYVCHLRVYSAVGDTAIRAAEQQEVTVKVPFGFTNLGAADEALDDLLKKEKEAASTGFWGAIGKMEKILRVLDYLAQVYQLYIGARVLFNEFDSKLDGLRSIPGGGTAAAIGFCLGATTFEKEADAAGTKLFDVPLQLLSCRPGAKFGWYKDWNEGILKLYNLEIAKFPDSKLGREEMKLLPGRSLKDNLYLSTVGLCVPGLVKNLDKLRQIKCRKIYCLQTEVKAGLTTVEGCTQLEGLLRCKYFFGELWYIIPFSQLWDKVINAFWQAWKDPFALAHTATILGCGLSCKVSNGLKGACLKLYVFWDIIGYVEQITGFITTVKAELERGGLQYCDSVLDEEATAAAPAESPPAAAPAGAAPPEGGQQV